LELLSKLMKRILSYLSRSSEALWQSALAPILFGLAGALLLDLVCQSILMAYDSYSGSKLAGSSSASLNLGFIDAMVGLIGGLAIWYWMQSKSSR